VTPRLVGGKDGLMIANMIQIQFGKANNWPLGAALAISTMIIVTAASLMFVGLMRQLTTRFR
jgi:spermidine/putrescine transport system permease protein